MSGEAMTTTDRRCARTTVMRDIDVGDHLVAVTERGTASLRGFQAVIVLSGAGDSQDSWTVVAERLAGRTQVITYDRAGLGRSGREPAPTVDSFLTELQAVLDACLLDGRYILVGHSVGGLITRLHTQQRPERVAGLLQVDATPEQIADDPSVRVDPADSGVVASLFKALTPFGVVRLLLRLRAFPLYPEQAASEAQLPPDQRRAWQNSVRRNVGPRGGTGREVRAVLSGARGAQRRMGVVQPQLGDLPLAVLSSRVWVRHAAGPRRTLPQERPPGIRRPLPQRPHAASRCGGRRRQRPLDVGDPDYGARRP
jgi:pimeloyl-ACP methyl ester carboxylesterase